VLLDCGAYLILDRLASQLNHALKLIDDQPHRTVGWLGGCQLFKSIQCVDEEHRVFASLSLDSELHSPLAIGRTKLHVRPHH